MNPRLQSPLAADAFARAVDAADRRPLFAVGTDVDERDEFDRLLDVVGTLRRTPAPAPRQDFVRDLRAQLMATELPEVETTPHVVPIVSRRRRRISAAAAAAAMVMGSAGVAAAAQSANPGDALYPAKRGIETIQENLSMNPAAQGSQRLADASTRLSELAALMRAGSVQPQTIDSELTDFSSGARSGSSLLLTAFQSDGSAGDVATVRQFTTTAATALQSLRAASPAATLTSFSNASSLVADIDQRARTVCASCSSAAPVQPVALPVSQSAAPAAQGLPAAPTAAAQAAPAAPKPATTAATPNVPTKHPVTTPAPAPAAGLGSTLTNTVGGLVGTATPSAPASGSTSLVSGLTGTVGGAVGGAVSGLSGTVGGLLGGL